MMQLTIGPAVFGPYTTLETLSDRYQADGIDLPFSVVGEGGEIGEWEGPLPTAPVPVPQVVTMRQARLALLGAGLLPGVATAIAALPSPQKEAAGIEWEYSQTVERHRGFVLLLGGALGLTSAQLDALFIAAGAL